MPAKYSTTYKATAPGGYGGTHVHWTRAEQRAFVQRAQLRGVGPEWIEAPATERAMRDAAYAARMEATHPERILCDPTARRYRVRTTVAAWDARPDALIDASAYLYSAEAAAMDLDCWRVVDGIDADAGGQLFDVWLASGRCLERQLGSAFLYVSEAHAAALAAVATAGAAS